MSNQRPMIRGRARRSILNAGAHRGAQENISAFREHNQRSTGAVVVPHYVDFVPGRAEETAERARNLGVEAEAIEAHVEEEIDAKRYEGVIFNVDNPGTLARGLSLVEEQQLPSLGYLLLVLPSERMLGLRFVLQAHERERREEVRAFFAALATMTARSGAKAVLGEDARTPHTLMEPLMRSFFALHTAGELSRMVVGAEPEHSPVDVSSDGERALPLLIAQRTTLGEPDAVVEEAARRPHVLLPRGKPFMVAEVTEDRIRLHEAWRQRADGQLAVRKSMTLDERLLTTFEERPPIAEVVAEQSKSQEEALRSFALLFGTLVANGLRGSGSRRAGAPQSAAPARFETVRTDVMGVTAPVLTTD